MHLETERLLMPPLSGQHSEALAEVYADPDVARYTGGATLAASPRSSTPTTHRAGRWPPGSASASTART
ncbi:hypothetical protein ACI79G_11870 [Geodermatophilus sp. SYSU D00779]